MGRTLLCCAALAGCGAPAPTGAPEPLLVSIETYLASPDPNDATLDRAHRRCQTTGRTAVFRETAKRPSDRTVTHIYECVAGIPGT